MDLFALLSAAIGATLSAVAAFLEARGIGTHKVFEWLGWAKPLPTAESSQDRVERLTTSLLEATALIDEIRREIEKRQELADRLQSDIDAYSRLAALKKNKVEAVSQVLRGELRKEGRRSFRLNFALNFAFFLLGVAVTWVLTGGL